MFRVVFRLVNFRLFFLVVVSRLFSSVSFSFSLVRSRFMSGLVVVEMNFVWVVCGSCSIVSFFSGERIILWVLLWIRCVLV